jgi:hypothetical protein
MTSSPSAGSEDPSGFSPRPRLRASDADREATVRVLHDAVGRGLLTLHEADERMESAYATRFVDDLAPLTADLPPTQIVGVTAPGWGLLRAMALEQVRVALTEVSGRGFRGNRRLALGLALATVVVLMVLGFGAMAVHALLEGGHGFEGGAYGR